MLLSVRRGREERLTLNRRVLGLNPFERPLYVSVHKREMYVIPAPAYASPRYKINVT